MQIRFACEHCFQLLAVGANKIGQRVACPRCAKQIEVPDENGAAASLASRRKARAEAAGVAVESGSVGDAGSPAPESGTEGADDDRYSQFMVYDNTELVYESGPTEAPASVFDRAKVAVPRSVIYVQGVLLGVVALAAFTLGALMGSGARPRGVNHVEAKPCLLAGKVTLAVASVDGGNSDPGAVLVVVPEGKLPEESKIAVQGMRPDDPPIDESHSGVRALLSLGGAYVRTNADGEFRLVVPRPGKYRLLIVSYAAKRAGDDARYMEDLGQLTQFFREPTALVGRSKYIWTTLTVLGDIPQREFVIP